MVPARWVGDRGAGSVLAVALVAVILILGLAMVGLGGGLAARQRLIGAADAAALAAADAASGAVAGDPCALAAEIAAANSSLLSSCSVSGAEATVVVADRFGIVPLVARSRAGPAPEGPPDPG